MRSFGVACVPKQYGDIFGAYDPRMSTTIQEKGRRVYAANGKESKTNQSSAYSPSCSELNTYLFIDCLIFQLALDLFTLNLLI